MRGIVNEMKANISNSEIITIGFVHLQNQNIS